MNIDKSWAENATLPPPGNMMQGGEEGREVFVNQGSRLFKTIETEILRQFPDKPIVELDILDFGCGVGRITLPFYYFYKQPTAACDVDDSAITFLKSAYPSLNAIKTNFEPPLPFKKSSFDVVYAISVWTHFNENAQFKWLTELKRILRPNGVALISTSSYKVLESRRSKSSIWKNVSDTDLSRDGFIFKAAGAAKSVTNKYGFALHSQEYIRDKWSPLFNVVDIKTNVIENFQDLNVLQKPSEDGSDPGLLNLMLKLIGNEPR